LAWDLTGLVVTLGDGGDEGTTVSWAQQEGNIGLGGTVIMFLMKSRCPGASMMV
jgi:hypothetical protein